MSRRELSGKISPNLYDAVGLTVILLGAFLPVFISLRPNRIEKGTILSLTVAAANHKFAVAAVFVILMMIQFSPYLKKAEAITDTSVFRLLRYIVIAMAIPSYIWMTSFFSKKLLLMGEESARVSLSVGFWLIFIGLCLWVTGNVKVLKSPLHGLLALVVIIAPIMLLYRLELLASLSIMREFHSKADRIGDELVRHMQLAMSATVTGLFLSLFLAVQAYRYPRRRGIVMGFVNMAQVIPTLTLLGLLMIPLTELADNFPVLKSFGISGIGFVPAYIVLTLYAILPMTTTILAGFGSLDASVLEAAYGMGMTQQQVHRKVEIPMVFPYIYAGFSTALVQTVGNTILAGLVGGGGLGAILFLGLAQSAPDLVILGALLVAATALLLKMVLGLIGSLVKNSNAGGMTP